MKLINQYVITNLKNSAIFFQDFLFLFLPIREVCGFPGNDGTAENIQPRKSLFQSGDGINVFRGKSSENTASTVRMYLDL